MNKFEGYIREKLFAWRINAEIDDYGKIDSFQFKGPNTGFLYKKTISKEQERKKYYTTGTHTLGTTYPRPYDRRELIKKEFMTNNWYSQAVWVIIFTVLAIVVDTFCYITLFEIKLADEEGTAFIQIVSCIGAALAIDLLPIFFSHNLHRISFLKNKINTDSEESNIKKFKSEKLTLQLFSIINFVLFITIVIIMFVTRQFKLKFDIKNMEFWVNTVISLIPVATSLVCFIIGYLSYNPIKKKYEQLNEIKLYLQENINESSAMMAEFDAQPNYYETLKVEDEQLYDKAVDLVDAIADSYKSYTRLNIVPYLNSPADTTDLTASDLKQKFARLSFPLSFCDEFYKDLSNKHYLNNQQEGKVKE